MSVCSVSFLGLLLLGSAIVHWLPSVRLRQVFLAVSNAGFLYSQATDARSLVALGLFLASGYAVAQVLQAHPRKWLLTVYVTALLASFVVLKRYEFLTVLLPASMLAHTISIVGLSYMLFRQIHLVVDAHQGQIQRLSFWTYLNYQTNLFGLLAGPIQRYQEFAADWSRLEPLSVEVTEILKAYCRIFVGVIKVVVLAGLCLYRYNSIADSLVEGVPGASLQSTGSFLAVFYLYPAYIYLNFSGYCDMMIGGASLFGVRMPENFDKPFLSRNMIEFWTRWHKTLGLWIRDYVFTPMYKTIAEHWPKHASSLVFLCYFVAFFLAGVWHGSSWNFVVFGFLNGIGVAAAKLWENWLVKQRGRQGFKLYLQSNPIRCLAVLGTVHFVCLTILFVPSDLARTLRILRNFAGFSG